MGRDVRDTTYLLMPRREVVRNMAGLDGYGNPSAIFGEARLSCGHAVAYRDGGKAKWRRCHWCWHKTKN